MIIRKSATLTKLEGKKAYFLLENGQEVTLSREECGAVETGDAFVVQFLPQDEAQLDHEALAHKLIETILEP